MPSIFSTQNLQIFLRRKNFRPPPPPPPGPPGPPPGRPPGRGPRGAPYPPPPPPLRATGASAVAAPAPGAAFLLDSSAMILLRGLAGPNSVRLALGRDHAWYRRPERRSPSCEPLSRGRHFRIHRRVDSRTFRSACR